MNGFAKRILRKAINDEKQRVLFELSKDPVGCMAKLLNDCGLEFDREDNVIKVRTNDEEYIVLSIEKESQR